jgi:tetratricopeptide (TPR) repeat protein
MEIPANLVLKLGGAAMAHRAYLLSRTLFWFFTGLLSALLMQDRAAAQSACGQLGVDCHVNIDGHAPSGSSSGSDSSETYNINEAWNAYSKGNEELNAGNYESAIAFYKKALALSFATVHQISASKLRSSVKERLDQAQDALKAQRQGQVWKYEIADEANKDGVKAFREGLARDSLWPAGDFRSAVTYFTKALSYYPDNRLYRSNLENALKALRKADPRLAQATEAAWKEQQKRQKEESALAKKAAERAVLANKQAQEEQLALAKKYSALPAPPSPPQQGVPDLLDRVKMTLSNDASVAEAKDFSALPQKIQEQMRDVILRYVSEHLPSDYAQMYWNINKGTADDMNSCFYALRKDLAEGGNANYEKALETFTSNLKSRILAESRKTATR